MPECNFSKCQFPHPLFRACARVCGGGEHFFEGEFSSNGLFAQGSFPRKANIKREIGGRGIGMAIYQRGKMAQSGRDTFFTRHNKQHFILHRPQEILLY